MYFRYWTRYETHRVEKRRKLAQIHDIVHSSLSETSTQQRSQQPVLFYQFDLRRTCQSGCCDHQ